MVQPTLTALVSVVNSLVTKQKKTLQRVKGEETVRPLHFPFTAFCCWETDLTLYSLYTDMTYSRLFFFFFSSSAFE